MRRVLPEDLGTIIIIALYVAVTSVVRWRLGVEQISILSVVSNALIMICGLGVFVGGYILWSLAKHKPVSPFIHLGDISRRYALVDRLKRCAPLFLATAIFMPAFSGMKASIPYMQAFSWDPAFINADATIHGGDAWRLLEPLLNVPLMTFLITLSYHVWVMLIYLGVPFMILWHEPRNLRRRFLLSYFLCWMLLGTLLAIMFASVGPCFVDYFYGNAHFQPLMDRLVEIDRHYPLLALDVQDELIAWQQQNSTGLGRGISAMPSMHVSIATLFAILGWQVSRMAGLALTAFLLVIQIGSVLLGYHYAIDGYVSAVGTVIIWWFCGKMVAVSDELRRPKSVGEVNLV